MTDQIYKLLHSGKLQKDKEYYPKRPFDGRNWTKQLKRWRVHKQCQITQKKRFYQYLNQAPKQ